MNILKRHKLMRKNDELSSLNAAIKEIDFGIKTKNKYLTAKTNFIYKRIHFRR